MVEKLENAFGEDRHNSGSSGLKSTFSDPLHMHFLAKDELYKSGSATFQHSSVWTREKVCVCKAEYE